MDSTDLAEGLAANAKVYDIKELEQEASELANIIGKIIVNSKNSS